MRAARLIIKNFCGIAAADIQIPPAGILIKGGNARGKTSILRALRAVLQAKGVDPTAIRNGEDKAEILIDLQEASVTALRARRVIRSKGTDLEVTDGDGFPQGKPQTILSELFGSELDALAFYLADDKKRRAMIYEVMPMTVTAEDIARWTQGRGRVPSNAEFKSPGLEVIEAHRAHFYTQRTKANADAEEAERKLEGARSAYAKAVFDRGPLPASFLPVDQAQRALDDAQRVVNELAGKQAAFEEAREKAGPTRERISWLRARALGQLPDTPIGGEVLCPGLMDVFVTTAAEAKERATLYAETLEEMNALENRLASRENQLTEADRLNASLAGVESMNVPELEVSRASTTLQSAAAGLAKAKLAADLQALDRAATVASAVAETARAEASRLDEIVRTLTTVAPRELAERSNSIPGLAIGERITLDGIPLDTRSGKEQLQFAVDLAKRVRTAGKILTVDKLEALDEEEMDAFVKMAVAGGWQLIGTRVTNGEIDIIAIAEDSDG